MFDKIGQLKLKAHDGKYRMTDVCDIEGMFRIIESIPKKHHIDVDLHFMVFFSYNMFI